MEILFKNFSMENINYKKIEEEKDNSKHKWLQQAKDLIRRFFWN